MSKGTAQSPGLITPGRLSALFSEKFGTQPEVISSAPGRVNLIGEHTDYNGGEVLPIAIDRRTYIAIQRSDLGRSRVASVSESLSGEFDARSPVRAGAWWDYLAGVCAQLTAGGIEVPQFDALVISDVPTGAGLSSSAALEVATSLALSALSGTALEPKELAIVSWRAENQFVGVGCGVMDQFASALCEPSAALHLWCDTLETQSVPMRESVLIFDTATTRSLLGSEFNTRRAECEKALRLIRGVFPEVPNLAAASLDQIEEARLPTNLRLRARHVVEENARVGQVVAALQATGHVPGERLYASHESLRTQYECSTPELDWFVDRMAVTSGITGARLTGAGWGGCAIALGEPDVLRAVGHATAGEYAEKFGLQPRTWLTSAAEGARLDLAESTVRNVNG
ncbi:MAG: galactokinase [Gemmatimonadaceae bacterium]